MTTRIGCGYGIMRYFAVLLSIFLILCFADLAAAQSDPFGQLDRVYGDSVAAAPGEQVAVRFQLTNDELLSGLSIPLKYDTSLLKLTSVSFTGSRGEYIQTKIVNPVDPNLAKGHVLAAIIKITEAPIPAGNGLLFTANFTVSPSARIGAVTAIDSLFYPPGGYLMLTENSSSAAIYPSFRAGKVVVREPNRPPVIAPIPTQYVLEGDSLKLDIVATDPDNDSLTLAAPTKPSTATFTSLGGGRARLVWVPDYVGPLSSDGSPFTVVVWASDGKASVQQSVQVQVINRNRRPTITAPSNLQIIAGDSLSFSVSASDPDFETVTWKAVGCPNGAKFDNQNPAHFRWYAPVTDSGPMAITFIASDPQGSSDTAKVTVHVQSAVLYALTVDTVTVDLGSLATVPIELDNRLPVGSFNLLVNYDPSVLSLINVTRAGTRTNNFESFVVTPNVGGTTGNLRIVGMASLTGQPSAALTAGSGPIANLNFQTTGDLSYSGLSLPVKFIFQDLATQNDNTMTTDSGVKIPQSAITYANGYVLMKSIGNINIGDINLNGVAYEISDAIYFSNYFVNPAQYHFNALQYANSDVNHDGMLATIADLVRLINIIVNGPGTGKVSTTHDYHAVVTDEVKGDDAVISYQSECAVGGLTMTIETQDAIDLSRITSNYADMTLQTNQTGSELRLILYSVNGNSMPAGNQSVLTIPGLKHYTISAVDLGSSEGEKVDVTRKALGTLPSNYRLDQNYPNPFNPDTRIDFALPQAGNVSLTIYDALGRTVKTLVSGTLDAGQHTVTWHGTNSQGQTVSSGVYFYRLETAAGAYSRKMMLLK